MITGDLNLFSSSKLLRHSLSTPVSTILVNLELLSKTKQPQLNFTHHLERALIAAKYLKSLMTTNANHKNRFNLKTAIREITTIAHRPSSDAHLLSFLKIDEQTNLNGNKLYFQESLICLLNNAFEAYDRQTANKLVVLLVEKEQQRIIIKISDGANGFLQLCEKEDNYLAKSKKKNGGMGLQFAQTTLKKYFDAKFNIQTYQHKGSTIIISLPLA